MVRKLGGISLSVFVAVLLCAVALPAFSTGRQEEPAEQFEILWRIGGSGEYINPAIEMFREMYPDVEVSVEYSPAAHEILRPRFAAGNPPDIFQVNVGFFDLFGAIDEGRIRPLTDVLDRTPVGEDITIWEKLDQSLMNFLSVGGEHYILSDNQFIATIYYDRALFREKGWVVPHTWDDFVALSTRIVEEEDAIAPFVFPGQYPYYMLHSFFWSLVADHGGEQAIRDMNSLTPGFYSSESMLQAAERVQFMRDNGFFIDGLPALSHTEAQMEFINRRAAMLASGSWVYNEMEGDWPAGFELAPMSPPVRQHSDTAFVRISNSYVAIPADAQNPEAAEEFVRILFSEDVRRQLIRDYNTFLPVRDLTVGMEDIMAPPVRESYAMLDEPDVQTYITPIQLWYSEFYGYIDEQMGALVMGRIDAQEFVDSLEARAGQVRADPDIPRRTME